MKKLEKHKLSLNRETLKELTLRTEVWGGKKPTDTAQACSIGTCFKIRTQCH